MIDQYRETLEKLRQWAERQAESGWLSRDDIAPIERQDESQLVSLFREQGEKPLIVAFFGGTGVGKSSLLNRLAGEPIARTGVQRPTSREVTLYLHSDFKDDLLPENLPTEHTRIAWHNQDQRRFVAWLDLPDMDSTARENAALVEAWLPHVDWLIYVVSPERYHDDLGWRFLQQRGGRHAWLFVMNHWDEGQPEQLEDFRNKLIREGFSSPVILRTSCAATLPDDDFPQLEAIINDAIEKHGLSLLQSLGVQARIETAREQLAKWRQRLDDPARWRQAHAAWRQASDDVLEQLAGALRTSAEALSLSLRAASRGASGALKKQLGIGAELTPASLTDSLWSAHRHAVLLDDLTLAATAALRQAGLPARPAERRLKAFRSSAPERIGTQLQAALEAALAKPGTPWQRFIHRLMDALSWLLPLAAASWAVFYLANAFRWGTLGERAFLGIDFAIHSGMMIALAWFIPWWIKRRFTPSALAAVERGFSDGIARVREMLDGELESLWGEFDAERAAVAGEIGEWEATLDQLKTNAREEVGELVATA